MGQLLVKEKDIVVPGEQLAEGMDYLPGQGTRRNNDHIVATRIGLVAIEGRAIKLIPLSGKYAPKAGDTIIAKVFDVILAGWRLETGSAYPAMLNVKDATTEYIQKGADLTQYFQIGDYLVTKITNVTTQKLIDLTLKGPGLRKLGPGRIVEVACAKVPRIIGKKGSMVSMIKQATGCKIIVGQNGLIWISGEEPEKELLAVDTIKLIEQKSHISGLTEMIKEHLEKITGITIDTSAPQHEEEQGFEQSEYANRDNRDNGGHEHRGRRGHGGHSRPGRHNRDRRGSHGPRNEGRGQNNNNGDQ